MRPELKPLLDFLARAAVEEAKRRQAERIRDQVHERRKRDAEGEANGNVAECEPEP